VVVTLVREKREKGRASKKGVVVESYLIRDTVSEDHLPQLVQ